MAERPSSPSILRQLIEGNAAPPERPAGLSPSGGEDPPSAEGQAPAPTAIAPAGLPARRVSAQPTAAATSPRGGERETTPKVTLGQGAYLKILAETAPVAMAIFDTEMRYLYANHRWIEVFRLEQVELVGRSQYEVFPSLHSGWRHVYERALGGQVVRSDRDSMDQAGRPVLYRWEVRPWRNPDASIGGVMVTCLCIAGLRSRDVAESAAKPESAAAAPETGAALWALPLPVLALDAAGRVCRAGAVAGEMFLAAGLREGHTPFWQLFAGLSEGRDLSEPTMAAVHAVLSGKESSAWLQLPLAATPDAAMPPACWHLSKAAAGTQGLGQDAVIAMGLDVSGLRPAAAPESTADVEEMSRLRKTAQEALDAAGVARVRETRLRAVLDSIPCGLLLLDERGRPVYFNARCAALVGRPAAEGQAVEEWLAQNCRDAQHRTEVVRQWREGVWRKQLPRILSLTAEEGLLRDVEFRPASLPGGGVLVMVHDVTEDRRAEELLRATEAKFRTLVHENPLPLVLTDRSGAVFEANAAAETLLGFTRAELRRMTLEEWFAPEAHAARARALRELAQRGDLGASMPVELRHRDGHAVSAAMKIAPVPDAQGLPASTVQFFQPLEKSRAEGGGSVFLPIDDEPEPPPAAVVAPGRMLLGTDSNGRVSQWSDAATECFGVDREEAMGRGLHTFFRPSDASGFYADLIPLNAAGGSIPVEWSFYHPKHGRRTGKFILVPQEQGNLSVALMADGSGLPAPSQAPPPAAVQAAAKPAAPSASPTTSPPAANAASRAPAAPAAPAPAPAVVAAPLPARPTPSALERERLLLGEAHHRVKNHLQIITSMLNLQLSTLAHDDAKEALRSSQNRVRSIAALHQHLYSLAVGEAGGFAEFALGLIAHLRECYEVSPDRVRVDLTVPHEPVPEEWLMPLALSLNEMVSNAFKHAYRGNRRGRMKINLHLADGTGVLSVQDDGAGLPPGFDDHRSSGLGLKIMRVFAGQLGGEIHVSSGSGQGATFELRFPFVPAEA